MSDDHRGLPHDLPEYEPNWPAAVKVKARVYKLRDGWGWGHDCSHTAFGVRKFAIGSQDTQPAAFAAALKHARGCW